jgi:ATP-dependent Lon protease
MFPLGTVLFPGAGLPLHVFEERYRQLVADCLDSDRRFGVVLIERGSEVGGGDVRFDVGTVAEIGRAVPLEDGRFLIGCIGRSRVRVVDWLDDDPYPRAVVEPAPESGRQPDPPAIQAAYSLLRQCAAMRTELGEQAPPVLLECPDDPEEAVWRACDLAPIGPLDQLRLLRIDSPAERLSTLVALLEDERGVLARRLGGGQEWRIAPPDWS